MKRNDVQLGRPAVLYANTKASIEALSGLVGGEIAYATDTGEDGVYDAIGTAWVWGRSALTFPLAASLGGTGINNGASASLTLPNLAITLGGGGAAQTYTLPSVGGTFALLNAVQTFSAAQKIQIAADSTTAFLANRSDGVVTFVVDTMNRCVGVKTLVVDTSVALDIGGTLRALKFQFNPSITSYITNHTDSFIYGSSSGGAAYPFLEVGNVIIQPRTTTGASKDIVLATGSTTPVGRLIVYRTGGVGINVNVPLAALHTLDTTTNASAVLEVARVEARISTASTGGGTGFGVGQSFYAETATNGTNQQQGLISTSWIDATNASRKAKMGLSVFDTAARLGIEIEASGTAVKIGLFGGTTAVQQVLNAYTSDGEGAAYTGIDNAQAGTVYATVADLNQLRVAYETLRASYDDLRTKLQTSTLVA